ncbi:MAG TPA: TRAM domain-containing protein, partial [Propionibacterium sp.]|nr:TRAM domain-containing protein [Propionibacterium sp.]
MTAEMLLERVAHGGLVVGRLDGKVVFTTGGLPGERVLVEVTDRGSRFDRARVVEVVEAAPGRVEPPCPIAGRCG